MFVEKLYLKETPPKLPSKPELPLVPEVPLLPDEPAGPRSLVAASIALGLTKFTSICRFVDSTFTSISDIFINGLCQAKHLT
jgi:hypothetical protein